MENPGKMGQDMIGNGRETERGVQDAGSGFEIGTKVQEKNKIGISEK